MARTLSKENLLQNSKFMNSATALYGDDTEAAAERYSSLTEGLTGDITFFSSPGRAELVGNHTDHNHGFVLASSINLDVVAAVVGTKDNKITVNSAGYPAFTVDIDDLKVNPVFYGTSDALVKGVVKGFIDRGYKAGGFIANTHSNIFKGAGVSSSAAFELLLCEILNVLYNDGKLDFVEKAIISQYAENVYFGKPSGLMDQLTISHGGVSFMDFADPKMPKSDTANWNFDDLNIVIINCGGDHCNLTDEYAAIRKEMGEVAAHFGKSVLRDVGKAEFMAGLTCLARSVSGRAILRAIHFFDENERALNAKKALDGRDKKRFLEIINESGDSSYKLLQNCYPASDTEQRVPLALALAKEYPKVLASRVHGGGFAGTILAFLEKEDLPAFEDYMKNMFGSENVFAVSIRKAGAVKVEK
ncbi:MAG TPA: galactokinase family protein [Clostridia bacterium]|nr:galactokinase family protein [Clostridia bacterium]